GAVHSHMPLAREPHVVAVLTQIAAERSLPGVQVLLVSDVALIVREQLMAEGGLAGEQTGARRSADRSGRIETVEDRAIGGDRVQPRSADDVIAVAGQRVDPV